MDWEYIKQMQQDTIAFNAQVNGAAAEALMASTMGKPSDVAAATRRIGELHVAHGHRMVEWADYLEKAIVKESTQ